MPSTSGSASGAPDVRRLKQDLRRQARARRDALSQKQQNDCSELIFEQFKQLDLFKSATKVHCYLSFGSEVATDSICKAVLRTGKQLYAPRVDKRVPGAMEHVKITAATQYTVNKLGIREPLPLSPGDAAHILAEDFTSLDLVVLPLLAFDPRGIRLGYGGGYYDRFLMNCAATSLGVAFNVQEFNELPVENHDKRLDAVLTESGLRLLDSGNP